MSNLKPKIDAKQFSIDKNIMSSSKISSRSEQKIIPQVQIEIEFNSFEKIDLDNTFHLQELEKVCPVWLIQQSHPEDRDLFMSLSRFDHRNKTFVVGCMRNDGLIISFKRRKLSCMYGKWITRKGTHPNSILFMRIFTDNKPIYIVEGHRDSLTATLLGLDYIMLPSAGYKYRDKSLLLVNEKRKIIALAEDKPAFDAMCLLMEKFGTGNTLILESLGTKEKKVDLSDYVQGFKSIEEVCNELPH